MSPVHIFFKCLLQKTIGGFFFIGGGQMPLVPHQWSGEQCRGGMPLAEAKRKQSSTRPSLHP